MAEIEVGTVYAPVKADMSEFASSAAEGVEGATGGLNDKLKGWGSTIGLVAGSAFALNFGKKGLTAAAELEKVSARLELGLEAIGPAAAASLDPILQWARDFSLETGIAETAIVDMSSRLTAMGTAFFQAVGPQADEMLQLLVEDINDMASATGQTSARLMRSLGPALLNAPLKAIPILQKYGGISEDVAKQVTALANAGDNTQASILLLNTIEQKWGGTTAEIADPLTRLKNTVTLLQTEVGKLILPVVETLANFAKWTLQNKALVGTIVGGAGLLYAVNKVMSVMDKISNSKVVTFLLGMGEGFQEAGSSALNVAADLGQVTQSATAVGEAVEGTGIALEQVSSVATITSGTIDGVTVASKGLTAAAKASAAATASQSIVTTLGTSVSEASMIAENQLAVAKGRTAVAAEAEAVAMGADTAAKNVNIAATSRLALVGKGLLATLTRFGGPLAVIVGSFLTFKWGLEQDAKAAAELDARIKRLTASIVAGKRAREDLVDFALREVPSGLMLGINAPEGELSAAQKQFVDDANERIDAIGRMQMAQGAAIVVAERFWKATFGSAQRSISQFGSEIDNVASIVGIGSRKFQTSVATAMTHVRKSFLAGNTDLKGWEEFVGKTMDSARAKLAAFRESAAANLDFVASSFSEIAQKFQGDSQKIADALTGAFQDEQGFFKDLNLILKDGTEGSKLLVQQLLAMGPAGAKAAHTIATGSDAARAQIETTLRKSEEFANRAAGTMQRQIVGTLQEVKDLLTEIFVALARKWGLEIDVDTTELDFFAEKMRALGFANAGGQWYATANLTILTSGEGSIPDTGNDNPNNPPNNPPNPPNGPRPPDEVRRGMVDRVVGRKNEPIKFKIVDWRNGLGEIDEEMAFSDPRR